MAHFAEIQDNVVIRVLRVPDSQEHRGQDYLSNDLGLGGTWIQTSYNGNIRGRYAGIGMIYNEEYDIFHPPQRYSKWTLNTETCQWDPPIPKPRDGKRYLWDDDSEEWILRT